MKELRALSILLLICACLALAACSKPAANLGGTSWTLASYTAGGVEKPVLAGTEITLTFTKDGRVNGRSGCNQYFAGYKASGSALTFTGVGSTEMACTTLGVMEQEQVYLNALQAAKSYTVQGGSLRITGAGGEILAFNAR
jgi:heat shock protein HslJ